VLDQFEGISIIIPVYNVEKYLPTILNQIISQSYCNFEVILVNDGSTDQSGYICDQFQKNDWRIRVVHKNNGGLSSARNAGIDIAKGKYIVFIDPDDQLHSDYINELYKIAESHQCDAIVSGYQTVPTNEKKVPGYQLNEVMDGKTFVLSSKNIHSNNDLCFVWRYFYKLQVIKDKKIRFNEEVFIGEDVIFNLEFLLHSKRVYAVPNIYYFYTVNNPTSLMRVSYKPNLESSLILQHKVRKKLSEEFNLLEHKHYRLDMANYYIKNIYRLIINNYKKGQELNYNEIVKRILNYEMISNSVREIGFIYHCKSIKEYIYYLAIKYKFGKIIVNSEFNN
jgi:glycosyltransferase EpsJ